MTPPGRRRWQIRTGANGHSVVVHLTVNGHFYECTCGDTGPMRGDYNESSEDAQQHLDTTDQPRKDRT